MDVSSRFRKYMYLERKRSGAGLNPSELRDWIALKRALGREFSPEINERHADARRSLRVPTQLSVSFTSLGELQQCLMTNLSRGGLFIVTDHLVEIGTRLTLRVRVEETGDEIELPVEVASHNLGARMETPVRGMGMRFRDLSPQAQKQIDELYERAGLRAAGSDAG